MSLAAVAPIIFNNEARGVASNLPISGNLIVQPPDAGAPAAAAAAGAAGASRGGSTGRVEKGRREREAGARR